MIEEHPSIADELREAEVEVILGNAGQPDVLDAVNVAAAKFLISAVPNPFESGNLIERARARPGEAACAGNGARGAYDNGRSIRLFQDIRDNRADPTCDSTRS